MNSTTQTQFPALSGLDSFLRPLSVADIKSCTVVECTFPEEERCSEEKFHYRLTYTPDLCLGLFIKDGESERLIGHVIANRASGEYVTDGSMMMPENWQALSGDEAVIIDGQVVGNDPKGSTVAIHSVVIIPEFQGKGVGKALVDAYIQYIKDAKIPAKRLAMIAHGHLIKFYESSGFEKQGLSKCQFAGGGWYDLVLDL